MGAAPTTTPKSPIGRRIIAYVREHPDADAREIREVLGVPKTTAVRWYDRAKAILSHSA